jgi:hypothetical protein
VKQQNERIPMTLQRLADVPADEVDTLVKLVEVDPRYIRHEVLRQPDGKFTIEAYLRSLEAAKR